MNVGDRRLEAALDLFEQQKQEYRLREVNHHIFLALRHLATTPQADIDPEEISPREILSLSDECQPFEFSANLVTKGGEQRPPDLFLSLKDGSALCFEFKTTWGQRTTEQLVAYASATHWQAGGQEHPLDKPYAVLAAIVDISKTNVAQRIRELKNALARESCTTPVVILNARFFNHERRGDEWIRLRRVQARGNPKCIPCSLGDILNRQQEIEVSIRTLNQEISRIHRTSDEVTPVWAAVQYWQHYLGNRGNAALFSPTQRRAIQTRQALPKDDPIRLTDQQAGHLPPIAGVDRPLTSKQQRTALRYLEEAGLAVRSKADRKCEIPWCEVRKIRIPLLYKGHKDLKKETERNSENVIILNWAARQARRQVQEEDNQTRKRLREIDKELVALDEESKQSLFKGDLQKEKDRLLTDRRAMLKQYPDLEK